ncbi:thioesterase II family protein [Brevibacillus borstelensis]|uniref:thioesterase II family protein n=1 Tax=Brevibacillus borstelensis TaxID=45462 RepID=UPI0030C2D551
MMGKIQLFCIPYAGGSGIVYDKWASFLHPSIEYVPIELAGRGRRFKDRLYQDWDEAIADISSLIASKRDGSPFVFFGHSMGGLLAYELYYTFLAQGETTPEVLFVSGKNPPHKDMIKNRHTLSDEELILELKELGGTPEEILQNRELLDIVLPIIRSDFAMLERYDYTPKKTPLGKNLVVLSGSGDQMTKEVAEWKEYTSEECTFYSFEGGHFFLHDFTEQIVQIINHHVVALLKEPDYSV